MSAWDRLAQIQDRAEKATDGPWLVGEEVDGVRAGRRTVIFADGALAVRRRVVTVDQTRPHHEPAERNIEFIAHARADVPRLVSALRAVLDQVTEWRDESFSFFGGPVDEATPVRYECAQEVLAAVEAALGEGQ